MESRHYFIHGLTVASEIALPAPEVPMPRSDPDVRVRRADSTEETDRSGHDVIAARDEPFRFRILRQCDEYHVEFGAVEFAWSGVTRQVKVRTNDAAAEELASLLMVGVGLVLPATLQGRLVLHASGLSRNGATVAVLGRPGSGKSTVALRLCLGGWSLMADDALALADRDGLWAYRGSPELRLRPHAARDEWMFESGAVRSSFDGRRVVSPQRIASADETRMACLLFPRFVADGPAASTRRLRAQNVAVRLLSNLRIGSWCDSSILAEQTALAASVARSVPGFELSLRHGEQCEPSDVEELAHAVDSCLAS